MAPRQREMPAGPDCRRMIKLLDTLTSYGHRQGRIFVDRLAYCDTSLRMLQFHALSATQTMRHESQKTTVERTCRAGNHSAGQLCSGARQCQGLRKSANSRRPLTPPARRKNRPVTL